MGGLVRPPFFISINTTMIIIKRIELVTLEIVYFMPDYQHVLQEFIWRFEDRVPEIPRVHKFLNFWKDNIDAVIHEVIVSSSTNNVLQSSSFYEKI